MSAALKRKLHAWELQHLREVTAEQQQLIEHLQAELADTQQRLPGEPESPMDHLRKTQRDVRLLFRLIALTWLMLLCAWWLSGCSTVQTPAELPEPPAALQAACPPLGPEPARQDIDAILTRAAEIAHWYESCREAALYPEARRVRLEPPGWPVLPPPLPPSWGLRAPELPASGAAR